MTLPETDFLAELRAKDPCTDGWAWARENQATSVADAWARLPRADWMLWLAEAFGVELDADRLRAFAFECADRAVRIHAVAALRSAGLGAEADSLAAVAPIMDAPSAKVAAKVAAWRRGRRGRAARSPPGRRGGRLGRLGRLDRRGRRGRRGRPPPPGTPPAAAGDAEAAWAAGAAEAAARGRQGRRRGRRGPPGRGRRGAVAGGPAARPSPGRAMTPPASPTAPSRRACGRRSSPFWPRARRSSSSVVVMCVLLIVLDAA